MQILQKLCRFRKSPEAPVAIRCDATHREVLRTFAIITTDANQLMAHVHNRMPVIVERADWSVWLGETEGSPASLLRPAGEDVLRIWTVSRAVNNVRNDGPELLGAA